MSTTALNILGAGASQGLVGTAAAQAGVSWEGRFGAVGQVLEQFLSGTPCDLLILTHTQMLGLVAQRRVDAASSAELGVVRTAIAVRADGRAPDVSTGAALSRALLTAAAIHCPDRQRSTAGIHFAQVLAALGIEAAVAARLQPHPNGITAMQALARGPAGGIGCTQATEILATPGVKLVAALPPEHALATVYTVAVPTGARRPEAARAFAAALTGAALQAQRRAAGFEGPAIRPAQAQELQALDAAWRAASAGSLRSGDADVHEQRNAPGPDRPASVAFDVAVDADARIVGGGGLQVFDDATDASRVAQIRRLFVAPPASSAGVDRRLLERALAVARSLGCRRVMLEAAAPAGDLQALYGQLGFRRTRDGTGSGGLVLEASD